MRVPAVVVVAALFSHAEQHFRPGMSSAPHGGEQRFTPGKARGDDLDSRRRILNGRSGKRRGQLRDANGLQ